MTDTHKPFSLGVIVGRFQVLHKGHADIIKKALQICDRTAIFIGSSQESGTLKNPLTYEKRAELMKCAFPEVLTYPLPDIGVGNVNAWGEYVLENVLKNCGAYPDIFVSGRESRRTSWIEDDWNVSELFVPKSIDISATRMIQFMIKDDRHSWEQYIEPALIEHYDDIRVAVMASKDILETRSI